MLRRLLPIALLAAAWPALAAGSGVIGENLLWLAIIILAARLFAPLAERVGFPAVLGELLLGVVLGNLGLLGFHYFDTIAKDPIIMFMAELGVIILLLQIGLETRLGDLVSVGARASMVGTVGIAIPFSLGAFVVGPLLLPGLDFNAYLFLGATLAATSVGITGRVFRDLGKLKMPEAQIVLGAAVIDDVLGLVILAVVSSLVQAGTVSVGEVLMIIAKAVLFLGGSIAIGRADRAAPAALGCRASTAASRCFFRSSWSSACSWPGWPTRSAWRRSSAPSPPACCSSRSSSRNSKRPKWCRRSSRCCRLRMNAGKHAEESTPCWPATPATSTST